MIIGLSGKKGAGKDTVGEMIRELTFNKRASEDFDFTRKPDEHVSICLALADPIKQIACDYFGVDPKIAWGTQEKKENTLTDWSWDDVPTVQWASPSDSMFTVRELLQYIGTELFRQNMHKDFWIRASMNLIKGKYSSYKHHVITDVRFPNEVDAIRKAGGVIVRIWRDNIGESKDAHASENALNDVDVKAWTAISTWSQNNPNCIDTDSLGIDVGFDYIINNIGCKNTLEAMVKGLTLRLNL